MRIVNPLTVADLIALLCKAPADAIVMGEFEGGIYPLEANDVRIGVAHEFNYSGRGGTITMWSAGKTSSDVVRVATVVLPSVGQSESDFPNRLDGEKTESDK